MTEQTGREHPAAFFRRYTKTWVHALATAALTAFGTLTFIDNRFAALAIAAYAVPPVVLYVRGTADQGSDTETTATATADTVSSSTPSWTSVGAPTDATLRDAVVADATSYVVGDGGTLLTKDDGNWVTLLANGPQAQSTTLRGADATENSGVWAVGDGGTVTRIDPETGRHVDHSEPDGDTTNLDDVAVAGGPESETVLVGDGSGRVRRGVYHDGEVDWDDPVTPGSGSSVAGISMQDDSVGWVGDTSQQVFETTDSGRTFTRAEVDGVSGTITDVAAEATETAFSTDDGVVYRSTDGPWTPDRLCDVSLRAVTGHGDRWLACGDGGTIFEREDGTEWDQAETPTEESLNGVAIGESSAVAVGDGGVIVECRP